MTSGFRDQQKAAGQLKEEEGLLQSGAAMDAPGAVDSETTASDDRAQPQDAQIKSGAKRPLHIETAGPGSQAKKGRGQAGQAHASTQQGTSKQIEQVDRDQSKEDVRPNANRQPSAGGEAQQATEGEEVSGRHVKAEEEENAEDFVGGGVVQRSVEEVAECLACDLCHSILRDPITAPECMHSFCRECVEAELVGSSGGNICPACARDGERTLLGANPFAYHRLQPDFVLEALVRKIFPRHILSDYEKRRPKYVPQRIGQLITEPGTRPSRARGQQMPPADVVPLFLHQKGKGDEDGTGKKLDMPYLRVPKGLLVAVLAKYVAQRVCEAEAKIQLFHKDKALSEGQTIHEAAEACLPPDSIGSTLLELCYAVVQVAPGQNSEAEEEPDGRPAKRVQLPT